VRGVGIRVGLGNPRRQIRHRQSQLEPSTRRKRLAGSCASRIGSSQGHNVGDYMKMSNAVAPRQLMTNSAHRWSSARFLRSLLGGSRPREGPTTTPSSTPCGKLFPLNDAILPCPTSDFKVNHYSIYPNTYNTRPYNTNPFCLSTFSLPGSLELQNDEPAMERARFRHHFVISSGQTSKRHFSLHSQDGSPC
jgi:hypothetical protein